MTADAHKAKALADALAEWALNDPDPQFPRAWQITHDAITQATKAETIEWLAAIAERYGFKPPEESTDAPTNDTP